MKRFIAVLTAATLFALGLAGAILTPPLQLEYTVLAVTADSWDGYHTHDLVNQLNELPQKPRITDYSQPEETLVLPFNGKSFTVTYEYLDYPDTTAIYWAPRDPQSGIPEVRFWVNRYTGYISRVAYWDYDEAMEGVDRPVLDQSACEQIAKDCFAGFVDDPQDYQLTCGDRGESWINRYSFRFTRYINGIETKDSAYICVSVYGDITEYNLRELGSMKDVTLPRLDADRIQRAIQNKLAYIFAPTPPQNNLEHTLQYVQLVKLNDGTLALKCRYRTTLDSSLTRGDALYVVLE